MSGLSYLIEAYLWPKDEVKTAWTLGDLPSSVIYDKVNENESNEFMIVLFSMKSMMILMFSKIMSIFDKISMLNRLHILIGIIV